MNREKIARQVVRALRDGKLDTPEAEVVVNNVIAEAQQACVAAGGQGDAAQVAAVLRAARILVLGFGCGDSCSFKDMQHDVKRLLSEHAPS